MKKNGIIILLLLFFSLLFTAYGADNNIEGYKRKLTQEILKNINIKLPTITQANKDKNREDVIMNIIKQLEELQKSYKTGDIEYDVLNEVILTLLLSQAQNENNSDESSSGSTNSNSGTQDPNEENQSDENGNNQGNNENNEPIPNNGNSPQIIPKGPSMGLGGEEGDAYKPLSQDEKGAIEGYLDSLKQEEKENMRLNKPNRRSQNLFNQFFDFDNIGGGNNDW